MIPADQPNCFPDSVFVAVSSKDDGQIQFGWKEDDSEVVRNRQALFDMLGYPLQALTLVRIRYHETAGYDLIKVADESWKGKGSLNSNVEAADCLVTTTPGLVLFLPIADCVGTVVYDPVKKVLALAHLGRHSSIAKLPQKLVTFLQKRYHSNPTDLIVWMAPSIQPPNYVLERVDFAKNDPDWEDFVKPTNEGFSVDLQGYNKRLFEQSGVLASTIFISPINTATNVHYWSHFTEVTQNKSSVPPRFAVMCALK